MQDILYDEYADEPPPGGVRRLIAIYTRWGGALLSLLVLFAFIFWAYRLGQRDASDIPVIRAMDGPVRVQPADPGGTVVGNQGLEVNEILAGDAAGQPERISIAPATLPLRDEDTPAEPADATTMESADDALDPESDDAALLAGDAETDDTAEEETAGESGADIAALIEQANTDGGADIDADLPPEDAADIDVVDDGINPDVRPLVRPRNFSPAPAPAPEQTAALSSEAATPAAAGALNPENLPAGTRLVQLGAFDSSELAEGQWGVLQGAHADLLGGKDRFVQRAEQNGRVFFRLRVVGFDDRNAQRAMCEALRARDVDCIPVTVR